MDPNGVYDSHFTELVDDIETETLILYTKEWPDDHETSNPIVEESGLRHCSCWLRTTDGETTTEMPLLLREAYGAWLTQYPRFVDVSESVLSATAEEAIVELFLDETESDSPAFSISSGRNAELTPGERELIYHTMKACVGGKEHIASPYAFVCGLARKLGHEDDILRPWETTEFTEQLLE